MELKLVVGNSEKTEMIICRNWFTGSFYYIENGKKKILKSAFNPSTHINITLSKSYKFTVGMKESHEIIVTHRRPLFFAGFRPQTYEIMVDGVLTREHKGY